MSTRLPSVGVRRVVSVFETFGFEVMPGRGKGSHVFMRRAADGLKLTVPSDDPVSKGTLRSLIRAAGLTVDQFVAAL